MQKLEGQSTQCDGGEMIAWGCLDLPLFHAKKTFPLVTMAYWSSILRGSRAPFLSLVTSASYQRRLLVLRTTD